MCSSQLLKVFSWLVRFLWGGLDGIADINTPNADLTAGQVRLLCCIAGPTRPTCQPHQNVGGRITSAGRRILNLGLMCIAFFCALERSA